MLLLRVENGGAGGEREIIQIGRHRPDVCAERGDLVDVHAHQGAERGLVVFREIERGVFAATDDGLV